MSTGCRQSHLFVLYDTNDFSFNNNSCNYAIVRKTGYHMNVMLVVDFFAIIVGLGLLWRAGDYVVHYTMKIADAYNISTFFLGFIVLAIAADIPELAIALTSAWSGASGVAVGDIIGANFTDVALVVGFTLLLAGHKVSIKKSDTKNMLIMLLITALIMGIVYAVGSVTRWMGIGLITVYALATVWLWKTCSLYDVVHQDLEQAEKKEQKKNCIGSLVRLGFKLLASVAVVMIASCITVHYAVAFAMSLQLPLEIIGATILGVGTSLPELVLSINALRRGEYALALGPTLGTVLGQTTLVLGVLASLSSKPVQIQGLEWAFWFMFGAFGIIALGLMRKPNIGRVTGAALISLFIAYLSYQAYGL